MSIYTDWKTRNGARWQALHNHRFWAARPLLRLEPRKRHINHWSNYAYSLRCYMRERGSRIKWGDGLDHRHVQHEETRRKDIRPSCRVVRPYW